MLTINLEKKMIASKKKTISKMEKAMKGQDAILAQVTNILQTDQSNDLDELKMVGLGQAISNAHNVKSDHAFKARTIQSLKDPRIFTKDEIKSIAIKYGLRFLPAEMYKGSLPNDLAQKIREFKELGLNLSGENIKYNRFKILGANFATEGIVAPYMILAPKESFSLQERPKDPLFFASLSDGTFYLIHKWGKDLSVWNYVKNIHKRSDLTYASVVTFNCILLSYLFFRNLKVEGEESLFSSLFFSLLVGGYISFMIVSAKKFNGSYETNKKSWNSPFKD